jgi:hypothetical protein
MAIAIAIIKVSYSSYRFEKTSYDTQKLSFVAEYVLVYEIALADIKHKTIIDAAIGSLCWK